MIPPEAVAKEDNDRNALLRCQAGHLR